MKNGNSTTTRGTCTMVYPMHLQRQLICHHRTEILDCLPACLGILFILGCFPTDNPHGGDIEVEHRPNIVPT